MKIILNKHKHEPEGGCFGDKKSYSTIDVYYELNSEERNLLNSNKNILKMKLFDLAFSRADATSSGESARTVEELTNEKYVKENKGYPLGFFFTNSEIQSVENLVNSGAKKLKSELYGGGADSTTTEI